VPPSVTWGLTVGLLIAIVDAASSAVPGSLGVSPDVAENVDLLVNVILYAALGFRIGRWAGVVRDAAESGVIAGVFAATIWVVYSYVMQLDPPWGSAVRDIAREVVGIYALNVAIGGVVSWLSGWYGTIARASGSTRRP